MSEFERIMPQENPLLVKVKEKIRELNFQLNALEEVGEGAFATILSNPSGHCTGPYTFFTGDVVGVKDDPIDWNKQRIFEPDFRVYHYCPILETKTPTPDDITAMLDDAKEFIHEVGRLRWKDWFDNSVN